MFLFSFHQFFEANTTPYSFKNQLQHSKLSTDMINLVSFCTLHSVWGDDFFYKKKPHYFEMLFCFKKFINDFNVSYSMEIKMQSDPSKALSVTNSFV